eukprot:1827124-Rhodomonas_salina.1
MPIVPRTLPRTEGVLLQRDPARVLHSKTVRPLAFPDLPLSPALQPKIRLRFRHPECAKCSALQPKSPLPHMPVPSRQVSTGYQCSQPQPPNHHPVLPPSTLPVHPPSPSHQSVSIGPRPPAHPGPFHH